MNRVESYWNLHKQVFSVRAIDGPNKGRVILHTHNQGMTDVTFAVQPAGRAKVLKEQKKNVHAFVRGRLDHYRWDPMDEYLREDKLTRITYNPYKYDSFVDPDGKPVHRADWVALVTDAETGRARILALNPS